MDRDRAPFLTRRVEADGRMRTLLCAFDDREAGLCAMTRLIRAGVHRDDVHLQTPLASYAEVADDAPAPAALLRRLGRWLGGPPVPGPAGTYRDAIRHGSTVVIVHVCDDAEAARAETLMATFGAFDIERRAAGRAAA